MSYHATLFRALLRQNLASFIHKVFYTVSPYRSYQHNWHIEAIAMGLDVRSRLPRTTITEFFWIAPSNWPKTVAHSATEGDSGLSSHFAPRLRSS